MTKKTHKCHKGHKKSHEGYHGEGDNKQQKQVNSFNQHQEQCREQHQKQCHQHDECHQVQQHHCQHNKHNGNCATKCDTGVNVDVDLKPKVKCIEKFSRGSKFDVELDVKAKPTCHIKKQCVQRVNDCRHKCLFEVEVDVDFDCKPKVSLCGKPRAKFDLDVKVDSETHCRMNK